MSATLRVYSSDEPTQNALDLVQDFPSVESAVDEAHRLVAERFQEDVYLTTTNQGERLVLTVDPLRPWSRVHFSAVIE